MSVGRRRRAPPDPDYTPGTLLDWTSSEHWSRTPKPCRYCGRPTHMRDSKGSPADKVCAEQALAERVAEAAEAYETERLHP